MKFKIKEAREKVGLTQKELANELGIKPNTFNGYEKGTHDPKSEVLKQIAIKCNTTVDFLLGLTTEQTKTQTNDFNTNLLVKNFNALNKEGKEKLLDYSRDLVDSGNYTKLIPSVVAARSTNNDVPIHIEDLPDLSKIELDDIDL